MTDDALLASLPDDESGGKRLGPCTLWTRIGEGRMGAVYLGDHPRLGKDLAIKVLPASLRIRHADYDERFFQEAQAAKMIDDSRIVHIYEVGEADHHLYMIMEYVEGGTLRDRLKRAGGVLPIDDALSIIREICFATHRAHEVGIVHRDLKPRNILFTPAGRIKIVDFGLAKLALSRREITETRTALGTPNYMAPEQFENARHVDHRADIYSIGIMLYEMLAGSPPFQAETPQEIYQWASEGIYRRLIEVQPDIPFALSRYVDRMISVHPEDRPDSAYEVGSFLRQLDLSPEIPASPNMNDVATVPTAKETGGLSGGEAGLEDEEDDLETVERLLRQRANRKRAFLKIRGGAFSAFMFLLMWVALLVIMNLSEMTFSQLGSEIPNFRISFRVMIIGVGIAVSFLLYKDILARWFDPILQPWYRLGKRWPNWLPNLPVLLSEADDGDDDEDVGDLFSMEAARQESRRELIAHSARLFLLIWFLIFLMGLMISSPMMIGIGTIVYVLLMYALHLVYRLHRISRQRFLEEARRRQEILDSDVPIVSEEDEYLG